MSMPKTKKAVAKITAGTKTENAVSVITDIKTEFENIGKLQAAAKEMQSKAHEGTIRAYCIVIAHLITEKATTNKKDKKAAEVFSSLTQLGVQKAKARRLVQFAQGLRRRIGHDLSEIPANNLDTLKAFDLNKESQIKQYLEPRGIKTTEEMIAHVIKKAYREQVESEGVTQKLRDEVMHYARNAIIELERSMVVHTQEKTENQQSLDV